MQQDVGAAAQSRKAGHHLRPARPAHAQVRGEASAASSDALAVMMEELVRVAREASRRALKGQRVEARSSLMAVPAVLGQIMDLLSIDQGRTDEGAGSEPAHVGTYL